MALRQVRVYWNSVGSKGICGVAVLSSSECSLCGYSCPLQRLGGAMFGQSWQHGTRGLAAQVFALGSANILHLTLCWGSSTFSGVWGLLPHPLQVPCQQRTEPIPYFCSQLTLISLAIFSVLLCSRTWLGCLGLSFLFGLIFQWLGPGKKPRKCWTERKFPNGLEVSIFLMKMHFNFKK